MDPQPFLGYFYSAQLGARARTLAALQREAQVENRSVSAWEIQPSEMPWEIHVKTC